MARWIDADELKEWADIFPLTPDGGIDANDLAKKIESMPAADVAPVRHGRWTIGKRTKVYGGREIICSECGESNMVSPITLVFLSDTERYCCRCGAKMDGDEDDKQDGGRTQR